MLYIGGTGRTGSTMLDGLLGQFPGVFSGGELAFFWRYGLQRGGRCSCGEQLQRCPVWSEILGAAYGEAGVDARRMVELRRRFWSLHLPLMVSGSFRSRGLDRLEEFPAVVEQLYAAAGRVTGCRVLVDSSKEPHYSYILRERTGLDVYFLHMVRDPRAVGRSWQRSRPEPGFGPGARMQRRDPVRASTYYAVSNTAAELLWRTSERYAFLRYEDFVRAPHEAVRAIGAFVGLDLDTHAVLDADNSFQRAGLHSAWGNPNRFDGGRTAVALDDAWRHELPSGSRQLLTALNWPLMRRYGYGPGSGAHRPIRGRPARHRLGSLP